MLSLSPDCVVLFIDTSYVGRKDKREKQGYTQGRVDEVIGDIAVVRGIDGKKHCVYTRHLHVIRVGSKDCGYLNDI